jgi:hypothetical protein
VSSEDSTFPQTGLKVTSVISGRIAVVEDPSSFEDSAPRSRSNGFLRSM